MVNFNSNNEPIYPDIDVDVEEQGSVTERIVTKGRINARDGQPYNVERKASKDRKKVEVTVTRATCAGCNEFFAPGSSAGACRICGAVLCRKCTSRRCWLCRQPTCDLCGSYFTLSWERRYGCNNHQ